MKKEHQIQVETLINEYKIKETIELTDYLVECIEKTLKDSLDLKEIYKILNIED